MAAAKGNKYAEGKGRPTKYKEEYDIQAYKLCLLGCTDAELADFFDVNEDTIHEWKNVHPSFSESIKKGKSIADADVTESLYKRATGYSHNAVKIFNDSGAPLKVEYVEHYPPDPTSMIFWLKNRQPAKWRDKQITEHQGGLTLPTPVFNVYNEAPPFAKSENDIDLTKQDV